MQEGIYEQLINKKIKAELDDLPDIFTVEKEEIDEAEARILLSSYISYVTRNALSHIRDGGNKEDSLLRQMEVCNEIIDVLHQKLDDDDFAKLKLDEHGEILTSIYKTINTAQSLKKKKVLRPVTPLTQSSLFTGSHAEPNMLEELKKEIATSDEIEWLVSFIKWSGLRIIIEELRNFTERGGRLRIITTSYMEATDYKALQELSELSNTEIRVSLDKERTRLHAKAYLFKRKTGFSTAYIGSSNLSNPALTSGLEWNLKVTEKDSFDIIRKFEATFEGYWNDEEFKSLLVTEVENWSKVRQSLTKEQVAETKERYFLDIRPYHYQQEILDELDVERTVHGHMKNLVVAATGVGKTVISAFDFKRFLQQKPNAKLLFIAHREEILKQSMYTLRAVLKDANFGEMFVGRFEPTSFDQLFMSIQSWNSKKIREKTTADFYDFIIVDEFHHATAPTYRALLEYYEPTILLGLTATPERMDNQNVLSYFDDRIASEMRLTEAIDRKLLSPFHYFCVTDSVDLSAIKWSRRGYDTDELTNVYTSNDRRSDLIIQSINKYVTALDEVKALGFCVSVEHAIYMAKYFNSKKIPAIALHGDSSDEDRNTAKRKLISGEIKFIFVVDLYNEGIDIPEVNTVLFLRPTESLTVFLQQLGRGLRLADDKECLTVLDFVGQAHADYPFEEKFRALVGRTKHSIRHYIENSFFHLPKGSVIQMEKQAKEYILRNVKEVKNTKQNLIAKIKYFEGDTGEKLTLSNFLQFHHLTLAEFYGRGKNRSFERLKVEAGITDDFDSKYEEVVTKRIHALFHIDSADLILFYQKYFVDGLIENEEQHQMVGMLYYSFFNAPPGDLDFKSMHDGIQEIISNEVLKTEIQQVLDVCMDKIRLVEKPSPFDYTSSLRVHAQYTSDQVLAAFGYFNEEVKPAFREGVKYFEDKQTDIFFITLNKSDKDFSPSTQYEDYAISDRLFHWQSQNKTSDTSPTGKRYITHRQTGNKIALFVREYKQKDGYTSPFVFLGTADYVRHEGNKPISFEWRLHERMPAWLIPAANKSVL
ncbi:DEAD/DEAH box helicase [Sporosarcina koreensis]|uniref:DEAD/DEAH box helicase n=1 Tax=Bacillales TaxID=1385 RepID=UPI00075BFC23|nr:DEAD/DEAH box helicase [Sporosarcina koreensis]